LGNRRTLALVGRCAVVSQKSIGSPPRSVAGAGRPQPLVRLILRIARL
jgi:hypothetical protein